MISEISTVNSINPFHDYSICSNITKLLKPGSKFVRLLDYVHVFLECILKDTKKQALIFGVPCDDDSHFYCLWAVSRGSIHTGPPEGGFTSCSVIGCYLPSAGSPQQFSYTKLRFVGEIFCYVSSPVGFVRRSTPLFVDNGQNFPLCTIVAYEKR